MPLELLRRAPGLRVQCDRPCRCADPRRGGPAEGRGGSGQEGLGAPAGGGVHAEVFLPKGFALYGRVLCFGDVDAKAENSLLGDIDGDGGEIWSAEAGMEWTDGVSFAVGAAAAYDWQRLDGGSDDSGGVEWPENTLETMALVGAFRFFF